MLKLNRAANISEETTAQLNTIAEASRPAEWDKPSPENKTPIEAFKMDVMSHGLREQADRCVWCTLLVGAKGRRRADRDHIAPKGRYPRWTFDSSNIAIACEFCNGFSVKNALDTVETPAVNYRDSVFKVVHPYFVVNISDHITFTQGVINNEDGLIINGVSPQGLWTIEKLKLDSPGLTVERFKDYLLMERRRQMLPHFAELFDLATGRATVAQQGEG